MMAEQLDDDLKQLLIRLDERQKTMKEEDLPEIKDEIHSNNQHLDDLNGKVADHADILSPLTQEDTRHLSKISNALSTIKYLVIVFFVMYVISQIDPVMEFLKEIELLMWVLKFV